MSNIEATVGTLRLPTYEDERGGRLKVTDGDIEEVYKLLTALLTLWTVHTGIEVDPDDGLS
jgi:hypothetical protein